MIEKYEFWKIEEKWQGEWEREESFRVDESPSRPKYYLLEMFPYPSGRHPHGTRAQLLHR